MFSFLSIPAGDDKNLQYNKSDKTPESMYKII